MSRRNAARCTTAVTALLGVLASLSLGALSGFRICGLNLFDSLDFVTANVLLPLGGLLICLFTGWRWKSKDFAPQLYADASEAVHKPAYRLFRFLIRYVCPLTMLLLFLDNLGLKIF